MISCNAFSFSFRNIILDDAIQLDSGAKRVSYFGFDLMFFCFSLILCLLSLYETARISGNIIPIFCVPYNLYVVIRNVIQKCCLDYCYHVRQANRRRFWKGTLQYRMPSPSHELFKGFASKLLVKCGREAWVQVFNPPRLATMQALWGIFFYQNLDTTFRLWQTCPVNTLYEVSFLHLCLMSNWGSTGRYLLLSSFRH